MLRNAGDTGKKNNGSYGEELERRLLLKFLLCLVGVRKCSDTPGSGFLYPAALLPLRSAAYRNEPEAYPMETYFYRMAAEQTLFFGK
ncbi:MAG: hypothetical protein VB082_08735 [Christensenella sp.]|nr:hypothetical protein [Christensenella sp.]